MRTQGEARASGHGAGGRLRAHLPGPRYGTSPSRTERQMMNRHCLSARAHTHIHTRAHKLTHTRTHIHTRTCTHTHTHTHPDTCTHTPTHTHKCAHAHTYTHTRAHRHTLTLTHTRTHTQTHSDARTRARTHILTRTLRHSHARAHSHTHTQHRGTLKTASNCGAGGDPRGSESRQVPCVRHLQRTLRRACKVVYS